MRTIAFLVLVGLFLVACGGDSVPTLAPTVAIDEGDGDASPRVTVTPESVVPATWTPAPSPLPPTAAPPSATPFAYVVQAGDTLAEIAARFDVELQALIDANDIEDIDVIEVGQRLTIPGR